MNIIVLTGGESPEREVALRSGYAAANAFIENGHRVALIDTVRPLPNGAVYFDSFEKLTSAFESILSFEQRCPIHPDVISACEGADKVFLALHGGIGENGRLQAMLDCFGISYCGSGAEGCALAMDKLKTKLVYNESGILTPAFTYYKKGSERKPVPPCYPCVIKPTDTGSSIGISFVFSPVGLKEAVEKALMLCDTVLLEERIVGREFSVSVLENRALAVTEIIPSSSFYDYDSKYKKGLAREITPAKLPKDIYNKALRIAEKAHVSLGLTNFSRTDLILKNNTEMFYALETNALPGLTKTSILPQAALSGGITFNQMCEKMLSC